MTLKEAANRYRDIAEKLSRIVTDVHQLQTKAEFLRQAMDDNGDPAFEMSEAIEKLGIAMASSLNYAMEYEQDASKAARSPGNK